MLSTTLRPQFVRMEQKSLSKFLPWLGFEPLTSHLAVQPVTVIPQRTPNAVHVFAYCVAISVDLETIYCYACLSQPYLNH